MIDFFQQTLPHYGQLFLHFAALSLLSVGGAITLLPAMQQYLVDDTHWMSAAQFNASVSISQAAPGPNLLFVGLMGWYVGIGWLSNAVPHTPLWLHVLVGVLTALVALAGMVLPSTTLNYFAGRWALTHHHLPAVKAFKQGMGPIVIALLVATGWIMGRAHGDWRLDWISWLLTASAALLAWRTRTHLLWMLGVGAVVGALGFV
jgi:chromate transporter